MSMNDFAAIARCYDRFVGADYEKIIAFIDHALKKHFPDASLLCDVGCGSGTVTLGLLKKGYDVIGIDGSIDMLAEAQNKKSGIPGGEKALFLCQQLPDFELYGTVDAMVSTLDTLNYLTDPSDLDRLFYWFRNYLNPGGILIFDVNTLYKYQTLLQHYCASYDDADVFLSWSSQFDGQLCCHQLTAFYKTGALYRRCDEEQLQRYYPLEKIVALLKKYDFELLGIGDDYSEDAPCAETQRLTFTARKKDVE